MARYSSALGLVALAVVAPAVFAQTSAPAATNAADPEITTIRGCMQGERGNYIVVEKTGTIFVLKGVANKLDSFLNHEVTVKGEMLTGTIKTGIRPEKGGSNPSDTLHGVDGTPFQVKNPQKDVQSVAKHCKAADSE